MKVFLIVIMLGSCLGIGYVLSKQLKERITLLEGMYDFVRRIASQLGESRFDMVKTMKSFANTHVSEIIQKSFNAMLLTLQNKGSDKDFRNCLVENSDTRFLVNKPFNLFLDEFINLLFTHEELLRKKDFSTQLGNLSKQCHRSIDEIHTSIKTNYLLAAAGGIVLIILIL